MSIKLSVGLLCCYYFDFKGKVRGDPFVLENGELIKFFFPSHFNFTLQKVKEKLTSFKVTEEMVAN